jgi:hypothetical protein
MSFTRFHDDPYRIQKQISESSYAGRYALNVPGPGDRLPFIEDPQIRLQNWGANTRTNTIQIENDLYGLTRKINRDSVDYITASVSSSQVSYPDEPNVIVQESRATHPAWMYRNPEIARWEEPFLNPLANTEKKFYDNIQTRILEKDYFVPTIPVVSNNDGTVQTFSFR